MNNASDFHLRKFLPRAYEIAKPLEKLPPLQSIGGFGAGFGAFANPEIQSVFSIFNKAGELEIEWRKIIGHMERTGKEMGLPPLYVLARGGVPIDTIGAALRGTVGTINDMFRQPEILIEYIENEMPNAIRSVIETADITGKPDEVKTHCRTLIETAGKNGGYILAPGAASDDVKFENVKAILEAAKEYGFYHS